MDTELKVLIERKEKYRNVIFRYSEEKKKFKIAMKEWKFSSYYEADDNEDEHCICGKNIHHVYLIKNIKSKKILINGSDCIHKLDDESELKEEVKIFEKFKNPGWFSIAPLIDILPMVSGLGGILYLISVGIVAWKKK